MPTYEYRCPKGHTFEKFYPRVGGARHLSCPTCGKKAERLISGGAGLVFKGSGFYATDYKRAGEKKAAQDGEAKPAENKPAEKKPAPESPKKKDSGDT
jgi:putative FmdB family regulatory protein